MITALVLPPFLPLCLLGPWIKLVQPSAYDKFPLPSFLLLSLFIVGNKDPCDDLDHACMYRDVSNCLTAKFSPLQFLCFPPSLPACSLLVFVMLKCSPFLIYTCLLTQAALPTFRWTSPRFAFSLFLVFTSNPRSCRVISFVRAMLFSSPCPSQAIFHVTRPTTPLPGTLSCSIPPFLRHVTLRVSPVE